jgi:hypothetical protein
MSKTDFSVSRLAVVLTAVFSAASFAAHIEEGPRRLNFLVDNDLTVLSVSNEGMEFVAKASEIVGSNIMANVPLSGYQKDEIKKTFADARASTQTRHVDYDFDPDARNPNMGIDHPRRAFFKAAITPLFDGRHAPAGFFVKVAPVQIDYPVVLE